MQEDVKRFLDSISYEKKYEELNQIEIEKVYLNKAKRLFNVVMLSEDLLPYEVASSLLLASQNKIHGKENCTITLKFNHMKEEILRLTSDRKLSVCDVNGSLIFLQMSDVMFISALGKETVVRTLTDCIFAKNSIKELAQQTQDCFVMTHRSYLVNPQYITAIRRYAITMQDGTELPVPRKKYDEIRRQILSV